MSGVTVFSERYPPRNRKATGLEVLEVELEDASGKVTVDPNGAAVIGYTREVPLAKPKWPSFLSGEPGFLYRTCEIELPLTHDELIRLLRHDLRPDEFHKLVGTFGVFFEIHADFYDEDSGEALQPMEA